MSLVQQRLSFGEMPSEMFQEHVLYFGEERYLSRKIPIWWALQKVSKTWLFSHYGSKFPLPLNQELINCIWLPWQFKIDILYRNWRVHGILTKSMKLLK